MTIDDFEDHIQRELQDFCDRARRAEEHLPEPEDHDAGSLFEAFDLHLQGIA